MTLVEHLENGPEFKSLVASEPLRAKLLRAMTERVDAAQKQISRANLQEFVRLAREIAELGSWLTETQELPSQDQIASSFKDNNAAGWPLELAFQYRDLQRKKPRGRPMANRNLALRALEMKASSSRRSWMQVAIVLCPCGKKQHDVACKERIRQHALTLRKALAVLGV